MSKKNLCFVDRCLACCEQLRIYCYACPCALLAPCNLCFISRVTAVTSSADKAAFVNHLGADHVIVAEDLTNFHKRLPSGGKADVVVDCVGGPTMNASLRSVKPGGSVIVLGNVENRCWRVGCCFFLYRSAENSRSVFPLPLGYIILNSIRVCGSDSIERDHLRRLFAFMDTHSLRPRLHKVLPLHVRIAIKHDAFTRGSHLPV